MQKAPLAQGFFAVLTVLRQHFSAFEFPANREINWEFYDFRHI